MVVVPRKYATSWARFLTGTMDILPTTAASKRFSLGMTIPSNPFCFAARAVDKAPLTGLTRPSKESSPAIRYFETTVGDKIPVAHRMPTAMGRSKPVPSFLIFAGARLTVIRSSGKSYPELLMADLTPFLAFLNRRFGKPYGGKTGKTEIDVHLDLHDICVDSHNCTAKSP